MNRLIVNLQWVLHARLHLFARRRRRQIRWMTSYIQNRYGS